MLQVEFLYLKAKPFEVLETRFGARAFFFAIHQDHCQARFHARNCNAVDSVGAPELVKRIAAKQHMWLA